MAVSLVASSADSSSFINPRRPLRTWPARYNIAIFIGARAGYPSYAKIARDGLHQFDFSTWALLVVDHESSALAVRVSYCSPRNADAHALCRRLRLSTPCSPLERASRQLLLGMEYEEEASELQAWLACEKFRQALKKGAPRLAIVAQMEAQDLDPALLDAPQPDPPDEQQWDEEEEAEREQWEEALVDTRDISHSEDVGEQLQQFGEVQVASGAGATRMIDTVVMDAAAYARTERRLLLLFEAEKDYIRAEFARQSAGQTTTEELGALQAQLRESMAACEAARADAEAAAVATAELSAARDELQGQLAQQRVDYEALCAKQEADAAANALQEGGASLVAELAEVREKLAAAEAELEATMEEATDEQAKMMIELEAVRQEVAEMQIEAERVRNETAKEPQAQEAKQITAAGEDRLAAVEREDDINELKSSHAAAMRSAQAAAAVQLAEMEAISEAKTELWAQAKGDLEALIAEATADQKALRSELETVQEQHSSVTEQFEASQGAIFSLNAELSALQKEKNAGESFLRAEIEELTVTHALASAAQLAAAQVESARTVETLQIALSESESAAEDSKISVDNLRVAMEDAHSAEKAAMQANYEAQAAAAETHMQKQTAQHYAQTESLKTQMEELQASHAAALEAALAASAAALSASSEEHKAAATAQQEQMQAEHRGRVSSLESELASLRQRVADFEEQRNLDSDLVANVTISELCFCAFGCGFCGSFEAVEAHEDSCIEHQSDQTYSFNPTVHVHVHGNGPPSGTQFGKYKCWREMDTDEQEAVLNLGWTDGSWEAGDEAPFKKPWSRLSDSQQQSALLVGYGPENFQSVEGSTRGDHRILTPPRTRTPPRPRVQDPTVAHFDDGLQMWCEIRRGNRLESDEDVPPEEPLSLEPVWAEAVSPSIGSRSPVGSPARSPARSPTRLRSEPELHMHLYADKSEQLRELQRQHDFVAHELEKERTDAEAARQAAEQAVESAASLARKARRRRADAEHELNRLAELAVVAENEKIAAQVREAETDGKHQRELALKCNAIAEARAMERRLLAVNTEHEELRREMEEQRASKEMFDEAELRRLKQRCLEAVEKHPAWLEGQQVASPLSPLERTLHDLARALATGYATDDVLGEMDLSPSSAERLLRGIRNHHFQHS